MHRTQDTMTVQHNTDNAQMGFGLVAMLGAVTVVGAAIFFSLIFFFETSPLASGENTAAATDMVQGETLERKTKAGQISNPAITVPERTGPAPSKPAQLKSIFTEGAPAQKTVTIPAGRTATPRHIRTELLELQRKLVALTQQGPHVNPAEVDELLVSLQTYIAKTGVESGINLAAVRRNLQVTMEMEQIRKEIETLGKYPNGVSPALIEIKAKRFQQLQSEFTANSHRYVQPAGTP